MEMGSPDVAQQGIDPFAKPPIQIPLEAVTSSPAPESTSTAPDTEESLRQYLLSQIGSKRTADEKPPQKTAKRSRRGSTKNSIGIVSEEQKPMEPTPTKIAVNIGNSAQISPISAQKPSIFTPKAPIFTPEAYRAAQISSISPSNDSFSTPRAPALTQNFSDQSSGNSTPNRTISTRNSKNSTPAAQTGRNYSFSAQNGSFSAQNAPKSSSFTPNLAPLTQNSLFSVKNGPSPLFLAQNSTPGASSAPEAPMAPPAQNPSILTQNASNSSILPPKPSILAQNSQNPAQNDPNLAQNSTNSAQNSTNLAQNAPNRAAPLEKEPKEEQQQQQRAPLAESAPNNTSVLAEISRNFGQNSAISAENSQLSGQNTPNSTPMTPTASLAQNPPITTPGAPEFAPISKEEKRAQLERRLNELTERTARNKLKVAEAKKSAQLAATLAARAAELAKEAEETSQVAKEMAEQSVENTKTGKRELWADLAEITKIQHEIGGMDIEEFDDIEIDDFPVIFFSTVKQDPSRGVPLEKEPKEELDASSQQQQQQTPLAENAPNNTSNLAENSRIFVQNSAFLDENSQLSAQNASILTGNSQNLGQNSAFLAPNTPNFSQNAPEEAAEQNYGRIGAAGDVMRHNYAMDDDEMEIIEDEEEEDVENEVFEVEEEEPRIQMNRNQNPQNHEIQMNMNGTQNVSAAEKEDDEQSVEGEDEYEEEEESTTPSPPIMSPPEIQKSPEDINVPSATSSPKKSSLEQLLRARLLNKKKAEITPDSSTKSPENEASSPSSSSSMSDRVEECRTVLHKMCKFELNGKCERPRECTFLHLHNINDKKQQTQLLEGLFREIFQYKEADIEAAITQTMHFLPEFREFEKLMDQFFKVVIHKTPDYKNRLFTFFAHRR